MRRLCWVFKTPGNLWAVPSEHKRYYCGHWIQLSPFLCSTVSLLWDCFLADSSTKDQCITFKSIAQCEVLNHFKRWGEKHAQSKGFAFTEWLCFRSKLLYANENKSRLRYQINAGSKYRPCDADTTALGANKSASKHGWSSSQHLNQLVSATVSDCKHQVQNTSNIDQKFF